MSNTVLLANISKADVKEHPFPHLVVRNVLPEDLCARLIQAYPRLDQVFPGVIDVSNKRFNLNIKTLREQQLVEPILVEFLEHQCGADFVERFLFLFADHIQALYPQWVRKIGGLQRVRRGVRCLDSYDDCDLLADALLSGNGPCLDDKSCIRAAHVDLPDKLYSGMFYLRSPADQTTGGDLHLFAPKRGKAPLRGVYASQEDLRCAEEIQYQKNVLVLFLNSPLSIHEATARGISAQMRCFINLVGETSAPLYDLADFQARRSLWERGAARVRRLIAGKPMPKLGSIYSED